MFALAINENGELFATAAYYNPQIYSYIVRYDYRKRIQPSANYGTSRVWIMAQPLIADTTRNLGNWGLCADLAV